MRIFLMIDLHLSAFAPRWRFLYVVRIDAYVIFGSAAQNGGFEILHFKAHLADAFCTTRRLHPATRRSQFGNRPISASAFAPWCAHRCSSECPERFFHHSSLPFRIKTIAKTPPPITAAAITATIHHGKENLSLSTGELCSVFFS